MREQRRGITLVGLVVTIIILLILAGITISTLSGEEDGLITKTSQAKKAQITSEMKERLSLAIFELQLHKNGKATIDDITQEWIYKTITEYECKVMNDDVSIEGKKIKMTKNEITAVFIIDLSLNIEDVQSVLEFYYDIVEIVGDKIKILIHIRNEETGLSRIEFPDKDVIIIEKNKTEEKAIDYEIEYNKEYKIKIKSEDGSEKEVKILEYKVAKPIIKADTGWTNKDLTVEVEFGEINENVKKQISIDGGITYNTYTGPIQIGKNTIVKARSIGIGLQEESELEIKNIDKLEPKEFMPKIESDLISSTELTIKATAVDADATNEYEKSGIKEYQYYVYEGETLIAKSGKITNDNWNATGLIAGITYDIYVEAYDKAGNFNKSSILNYTKLEVYEWKKYSSTSETKYEYSNIGDVTTITIDAYASYPKMNDLSVTFDSSTGKWKGQSYTSYTSDLDYSNAHPNYIILQERTDNAAANSYSSNTVYYVYDFIEYNSSTRKITVTARKYTSTGGKNYYKGDTLYGIVKSNNISAFPSNGYQSGYWYIIQ